MLLAEYAITPDVFDVTSYGNAETCGVYLQHLKDVLLSEGLVRNLRQSEWSQVFVGDHRPWHLRGKELLKKLVSQQRLISFPSAGPVSPTTDAEWCNEALATHRRSPVQGIIVTDTLAAPYANEPSVAPIQRLPKTAWWSSRSPSLRLDRTLAGYQSALDLVLRHANSFMVIDPHFDPSELRYKDFVSLLQRLAGRTPAPLVEVHRVAWSGSSQDKRSKSADVETAMRAGLADVLERSGLSFEVYLWDDFHDRFLITDLVGISVPNGFDTTTAPQSLTTWTRLGRDDRDDVQREFDSASNRHTLRYRFKVP